MKPITAEMLQPVLIPIPEDAALSGRARVARQRASARAALDECARLCGVAARKWEKDENGAPQLTGGWYWSISHKPRWAAAVIAAGPVGIDVEHIAPRRRKLYAEVGDEDEWSRVGGQDWTAFFRIWTAKEAVLKANGKGIGHLSACRVREAIGRHILQVDHAEHPWRVRQQYFDDHLFAVTADDSAVIWHVHHPVHRMTGAAQ